MLGRFLEGFVLGFPAAATPGPFQAFLMAHATSRGWRRALPAAAAPLISDGPVIGILLIIFLQLPPWLLIVIRLAGGLFLLYLAWSAYRLFRFHDFEAIPEDSITNQGVLKAALVNALGPGPWLFWATVGIPTILNAWSISPIHGAVFLFGFYVALIGTFAAFVFMFSATRSLGPRVSRYSSGFAALALFGFAIYQLWQGIQALVLPV